MIQIIRLFPVERSFVEFLIEEFLTKEPADKILVERVMNGEADLFCIPERGFVLAGIVEELDCKSFVVFKAKGRSIFCSEMFAALDSLAKDCGCKAVILDSQRLSAMRLVRLFGFTPYARWGNLVSFRKVLTWAAQDSEVTNNLIRP